MLTSLADLWETPVAPHLENTLQKSGNQSWEDDIVLALSLSNSFYFCSSSPPHPHPTPFLFCFVQLIYHSLNAHLIRLIWLNLQTSKHITFSFFPPPSNIILRSFVFVSNLYCKRRSICNCYLCVQWKMVTCQSSLYLFGWRIKPRDCGDSLGE